MRDTTVFLGIATIAAFLQVYCKYPMQSGVQSACT